MTMKTTEERELLIAFQQWYNDGMQQDITLYSINNFLSTLPDEGEKIDDIEKLASELSNSIYPIKENDSFKGQKQLHQSIIETGFKAGYKAAKQSNPNPQ